MKLAEIRTRFLEYFKNQGHTAVKSSPLVPGNDPTLLFTNAGMVQFKDVFLGSDHRDYTRAVSVQRCLRAGGKHNDLENVGYTARHHTFFEMLGNFSFGDYFKREAINFAWDFLTKVIQLPPEKLWVTIYQDDDEAAEIWLKELKVSPERFSRCGMKDNFWSMGDTGPCGPCTEIFYDHGEDIPGGPPGSEGADLDRYIEIWNLVFMQYNRDSQGNMTPLPKPCVDTGMGLERIAAVVQGVHSNYEIDLFQNLIKAAAKIINVKDLENQSLKVLADHIRACSFLIADNVMPSNEGRGYVLRRIIRRAIRHGNKLGATSTFFYKLVPYLCSEMGDAYPELAKSQEVIEQVLMQEELQFSKTLDLGLKKLYELLPDFVQNKIIPGKLAFELYDTYGFPLDLTTDIARENNYIVDLVEFERLLAEQRERSKQQGFKQSGLSSNPDYSVTVKINQQTHFSGYEQLSENINVLAVLDAQNNTVDRLKFVNNSNTDDMTNIGYIISESTPFYAESGGQVGDVGTLSSDKFMAVVENTIKINKAHLHQVRIIKGEVSVGDNLVANVDIKKRHATARNHSATHLLHAALRKMFGDQVVQKGSYVGPDYLRFDFSYFKAVTKEQLDQLEEEVNFEILRNTSASVKIMSMDEAVNSGAMALFGEKYEKNVRVLNFGEGYSVELCGGTHVSRTGDIGIFTITSESSAASGIRRIEAITGDTARLSLKNKDKQIKQLAELLKSNPDNLLSKITQLSQENNQLLKELNEFKQKAVKSQSKSFLDKIVIIQDIKVLVLKLENVDVKTMRDTLDQLKSELQRGVIVLASVDTLDNNKVNLIAGVTNNCINIVHAGHLINMLASQLDGKGGGRPDMAQAGGKNNQNLDKVLATVVPWIEKLFN